MAKKCDHDENKWKAFAKKIPVKWDLNKKRKSRTDCRRCRRLFGKQFHHGPTTKCLCVWEGTEVLSRWPKSSVIDVILLFADCVFMYQKFSYLI